VYELSTYLLHNTTTKNSKTRIVKQVNFQNWNLPGAHDEETDTTLILFCVEALFHVSGYVTSQNKMNPRAENPMLTHKSHHIMLRSVHAISENIN